MDDKKNCCCKTIRSIAHLDIQYAHRFYGFKGEAQYLHGHTGGLTLEVEETVNPGVNMVKSSTSMMFLPAYISEPLT